MRNSPNRGMSGYDDNNNGGGGGGGTMSEENVTPYKGAHLRSHQKNNLNQSTLVVLPDK